MKYTFECSDKEFASFTSVLKKALQTIVDVKALHKARDIVIDGGHIDHDDDEDSDGDDDEPKPATVHPFRVVKPTEQEVEDSIVNEPEPLPKEVLRKQKMLRKGEKAFSTFIHEWLKGVDLQTMELIPNVPQPDRDMLLRSTANGPSSYPILTFVSECGGLQRAVARVTNDEDLAVRLCRFIVPPASIAFPDLADQYEYTNPFKKEDDEDGDA